LSLLCAGCAFRPRVQVYNYQDQVHNTYSLHFTKGKLDTSLFIGKDSASTLQLAWKYTQPILSPAKIQFHADTIKVLNADTHSGISQGPGPCDDSLSPGYSKEKCLRSTESILAVIRVATKKLIPKYNGYLRMEPTLYGRMTFRFAIAPDGGIISIYLLENTTYNMDFALDVMRELNGMRFAAVEGKANDIVSVPFTFSP
jgi:hypothetical protein